MGVLFLLFILSCFYLKIFSYLCLTFMVFSLDLLKWLSLFHHCFQLNSSFSLVFKIIFLFCFHDSFYLYVILFLEPSEPNSIYYKMGSELHGITLKNLYLKKNNLSFFSPWSEFDIEVILKYNIWKWSFFFFSY